MQSIFPLHKPRLFCTVVHKTPNLLCIAGEKPNVDKILNGDGSGDEGEIKDDDEEDEGVECYNKSKSFFDSISCEALERAKGFVFNAPACYPSVIIYGCIRVSCLSHFKRGNMIQCVCLPHSWATIFSRRNDTVSQ